VDDFTQFDGLGLAGLVRSRQVTPRELVEATIERIERLNDRLNAVVHPMFERARHQADGEPAPGLFAGVPFLLKDLGATVAGVPSSHGSRFFAGVVPDYTTETIERLQSSGLVFVAKTNTPELGLRPVTESARWGAARSPWDISRTPGGSSGGSAAAVAAGLAPMASASDGGGSIRIPAACCGLFGLKPTRARTPAGPGAGEHWSGLAIEHAITRSVRDSAALLDAVSGAELGAPYEVRPPGRPFLQEVGAEVGQLRVAFHWEPAFPAQIHPDCVAAVEDVARLLESMGHHVEELTPKHDQDSLAQAYVKVVAANCASTITEAENYVGRRSRPGQWEDSTWLTCMLGRALPASELVLAQHVLQVEARRLATLYLDFDVVLTPTMAAPPISIGALDPPRLEALGLEAVARANLASITRLPRAIRRVAARTLSWIPFTPIANFTGQPSMSVPLHWNQSGLPIGTMFTARFGDEAVLFRLAAQLEQARPWAHRRPPLHAS